MKTESIEISGDVSAVPHLHRWCDAWAMESAAFNLLAEQVQGIDLATHLAEFAGRGPYRRGDAPGEQSYVTFRDGIATFHIEGVLMKHVPSMEEGTSTVLLRRSLAVCMNDDSVKKIMLLIDSPGGAASGTLELGAAISEAAKRKPVAAYCEDMTASAAYWVASQAQTISANQLAKVGSIGVFSVVTDFSKRAEKLGIKVHVLKTGDFKGDGVPGTEIREESLAEVKRLIEPIHQAFVSAVASGRKMAKSKVLELADGRVHIAGDAKNLGLIDHVESFEEAKTRLQNKSAAATSKPTRTAAAATVAKPSPLAVTKPKSSNAKSTSPGGPGIPAKRESAINLWTKTWNDAVNAEIANGKTLSEATSIVNRKNPRLREKMLAEANSSRRSGGRARRPSSTATDAWNAAIAKIQEQRGVDRSEAMRILNVKQPSLRKAMLNEVNG